VQMIQVLFKISSIADIIAKDKKFVVVLDRDGHSKANFDK